MVSETEGALHPAPGKEGPCPRWRVEGSPALVAGGGGGGRKEDCPGPQGVCGAWGVGEMGDPAPHWVWSVQIPGHGSNLALSVWLSPDTSGPATQKPRQSSPALDRGSWSGTRCLFRAGEGGAGRKGPGALINRLAGFTRGGRASGDFQGRDSTLTGAFIPLESLPSSSGGQWVLQFLHLGLSGLGGTAGRLLCLPIRPKDPLPSAGGDRRCTAAGRWHQEPAPPPGLSPHLQGGSTRWAKTRQSLVRHQLRMGAIRSNLTPSAHPPGCRCYYNVHFTDEETEEQRGRGCSHSRRKQHSWHLDPGHLAPESPPQPGAALPTWSPW